MEAQNESFIFSYEDYKESDARRNCLTSAARITMAIHTSDARNVSRKFQRARSGSALTQESSHKLTIVQTLKKGAFCRKPVACFNSLIFPSPICQLFVWTVRKTAFERVGQVFLGHIPKLIWHCRIFKDGAQPSMPRSRQERVASHHMRSRLADCASEETLEVIERAIFRSHIDKTAR